MVKRFFGLATGILFFCGLSHATAATVCVLNKETGRLEPLVKTVGNASKCNGAEQAGRDSTPVAARKDGLVEGQVLAPPRDRESQRQPADNAVRDLPDPATQHRNYRLKFSDITVRLGVKRWLKDINMQLAYEAQKDFPAPVEGEYSGPISEVMLELMTSLSESSYPLRTCEYDNRVLLVVHRDDKCPLEDKQ